jgi:hypothetical protein
MFNIGNADLDKRPSEFESTRLENNYDICFGSEPKKQFGATTPGKAHLTGIKMPK